MPTAWSAGPHDVKNVIDSAPDGSRRYRLQCKCGWTRDLAAREQWSSGEPWRMLAAEHLADHPDAFGYGGSIEDLIREVISRREAGTAGHQQGEQ